ncbi:MAG TPA: hypothetical protein VHY84_06205 [Bryobacteraceae bacterium]|jgi:hypothetical protein|nr:hypothetical protein [Bryobacteraceae bacterium]
MDADAITELLLAAAAAITVVRLLSLNLAKRFLALSAYLTFLIVMTAVYGLLNKASALYFWSYLILEPLECIFSIFAVRELFTLTFEDYPGIRTVGRWTMYAGVTLALAISLLVTGFFWSGAAEGRAHSHLFYVEVSQRSIVFTLSLAIAAILLVLSKYPLHLSKNNVISSACFGFLFLCDAARLLIDSLAPKLYNNFVDWTEAAAVSACLLTWAALLKPATETVPARVKFTAPDEEHLLQQLDSLNQLLAKAARR